MTQYIDKSALVAEIESKIEKYTKRGEESDAKRDGYGMYWGGVLSCLNEIRTLCDTLEVKEINEHDDVDLDIICEEMGVEPDSRIASMFKNAFYKAVDKFLDKKENKL